MSLLAVSAAVSAYEPDTHKELSLSAVTNSVLAQQANNILSDFGLGTDTGLTTRSQQFPSSNGLQKTIIELIQDGADFEDNFPRSIQHFYDPISDKGLQHPTVSAFTHPSPDWALEDTGQISGQTYSYADAMTAFYEALTLSTKTERDAKWGQVFETLGHVIHHIQDMAQPQHVRNDLHCDAFVPCGIPGSFIGLYDKSLFESRSKTVFKSGIPSALTGYPAVTFPTAREFWTTRVTDAVAARRGIADFTNRNFVSKDTNFEIKNGVPSVSSLYSLPVPSGSNTQTLAALLPDNNQGSDLCQQLNQVGPIDLPPNSPCEIEFIENIVTDSYAPSSTPNQRAASLSLFDQYLTKYNVTNFFVNDGDGIHMMEVNRLPTINRFNIDAAHDFLIPRAVAYGAGMIDHLFRKIVQFEEGDLGLGWVIRNLTTDTLTGDFEIYYDERMAFNREALPNGAWTLSIGSNSTQTINFPRPADEAGSYILVFRGSVGNEQNVVAGHYAILPIFEFVKLVPDTVESLPDVWLGSCAWKSSAKTTRNFHYQIGSDWKGRSFTRIVQAPAGDRVHEQIDVGCQTGGASPIQGTEITTYTNWIEFTDCPAGSNRNICGTKVTNGIRQIDIYGSGDIVETDLRTITTVDIGVDTAMREIITDIKSTF